ncbi:MAG: hypothetical protein Fur0018_23070 [Anaerolineales bacterium]
MPRQPPTPTRLLPAPTASPVPPTPTPLPPTATSTLAPMGEVQEYTNGYEYLGDPDEMALGFNMRAGGAIGSLLWHGIELVDDTDFGRYVQVSPYDGDDVYIGGGGVPYGEFGWNPLQAGGMGGGGNAYAGTVLDFRRFDGGMYVKTLAKEWGAPDDKDSDTIYEVWAFLREGYFEVYVRATHVGDVYHALGLVEDPSVYFEFALRDEYAYLGDAPFTAAPMEKLHNNSIPGEVAGDPSCPGIVPTENWAAFARGDQTGLILATPLQKYLSLDWALCLIYDSPPVGYISSVGFWDFAPGDTREVHFYLIPGDIAEGRKIVYDLLPHTQWTFDLDTLEGWHGAAATVTDGIATVEFSPAQPFVSQPGLWINGRVMPALTLTGRAVEWELPVCLEYLPIDRSDWVSDPALCQTIPAGDFAPYTFDGSALPSWRDARITQLRLTSPDSGRLEIDSLAVQKTGQMLDFAVEDELLSLGTINQLENIQVAQGILQMTSTGDDPYFDIPLQTPVLADSTPRVEIRMRVSSGGGGQVFFTPETGTISEATSLWFELIPDGEFHTYTLDFSSLPDWTGTISKMRLDPTDAPGDVEIDYILIASPRP